MVLKRLNANWIVLLLIAVLGSSRVVAQGIPASNEGLDLVILIDQSGSMWGWKEVVGDRKSDPGGHRITGVHRLFERIVKDVEGTSKVHRISVVVFGNEAETILSNFEVRHDPSPTSRMVYDGAIGKVKQQPLRNTNTAAAFVHAEREITKMLLSGPPTGRKHIVLLLTDGRPAMPTVSTSQLKSDITKSVAELRKRGVELWVLALDAELNYWDGKEEFFWRGLAEEPSRARKALYSMPDLPKLFEEFGDQWLATKTIALYRDEFFCPPYIRGFRISVTVDQAATRLDVFDPDGRPLIGTKGTDDKLFNFEEMNPTPGIYTLKSTPGRMTSNRIEFIPHELVRLAPSGPVDMGMPAKLVFEVRDDKGKPLEIKKEFPVDGQFAITGPDGTITKMPALIPDPKSARFEGSFSPDRSGDWNVELLGLVGLPDGTTQDVFGATKPSFTNRLVVTNRHPYRLRFTTPDPQNGFRVWPGEKSANFSFVLIGPDEKGIEKIEEVVRDPETWLSVQAIDANGLPLGNARPLLPDAVGLFHADIPFEVDWLNGKGIFWPGAVYIKIIAEQDRLDPNAYLHSIVLPEALEGNRIDGNPLTVGPIALRMTYWIWLLVFILAGLLIAGLLRYLMTRTLPDWVVAKRDARRQGKMLLLIYDEVDDPTAANPLKYTIDGKARHNLDHKVKLLLEDGDRTAALFRVVRYLEGTKEKARITYRWKDESARNKKNTRLIRVGMDRATRLDGILGKNFAVKLSDSHIS